MDYGKVQGNLPTSQFDANRPPRAILNKPKRRLSDEQEKENEEYKKTLKPLPQGTSFEDLLSK